MNTVYCPNTSYIHHSDKFIHFYHHVTLSFQLILEIALFLWKFGLEFNNLMQLLLEINCKYK